MLFPEFTGLMAAAYTPFDSRGDLDCGRIGAVVEHLLANQVDGLYVCGSTGEGVSLTGAERRAVAEAYVEAAAGRLPVIVQVGHNSIREARELAEHAQEAGADAVSATCPSYFKIGDVETLIDCMAEIAAGAPDIPFFYYNIPVLTGIRLDMADFLRRGAARIENLAGMKFSDLALHEFQHCLELDRGRFQLMWGADEMLLGALATGARAAIGSTYNFAAPLYQRIREAVDAGQLERARSLQARAVEMVRAMFRYPPQAAMKAVYSMVGPDVGPCRLPHPTLDDDQRRELRAALESIGFFDFAGHNSPTR